VSHEPAIVSPAVSRHWSKALKGALHTAMWQGAIGGLLALVCALARPSAALPVLGSALVVAVAHLVAAWFALVPQQNAKRALIRIVLGEGVRIGIFVFGCSWLLKRYTTEAGWILLGAVLALTAQVLSLRWIK
jgi:hypothetical protein